MAGAEDAIWFEFVESKIFSRQVSELDVAVLAKIQSDLIQNPERGAVVKGTHGVRKARVVIPPRRVERVVVIDICISISNTLAEFTCSTCSAKENKRSYPRSRSGSSEH